MNVLRQIILTASKRARETRAATFRRHFQLDATTRVLDIGSETGENIHLVLRETKVKPENVFIADIEAEAMEKGREKFGYQTVLLDETGKLPFADGAFDLVYCSSVIEHATVAKEKIWETTGEEEFKNAAWETQRFLANEIRRVGRQYFVQTPARSFPIESHSWLPFVAFLPRPRLIKTMRAANRFWIKKTAPDFNLLDARQMKRLFPDAEIVLEKKFGLVKSIMAMKTAR